MDLTEEYKNLEHPEQPDQLILNAEIYKLQEFYSDIRYIPPEDIYRAFPIKEEIPIKKKSLLELFKVTIICVPYCIIKVEYD